MVSRIPQARQPGRGNLDHASTDASGGRGKEHGHGHGHGDAHSEYASTQPATLPTPMAELGLDGLAPVAKAPLTQVLVCSMVVGKPSPEQLQTLAEVSQQNNRNRGLTGVLLCGNGVFIHWLEGLDEYVQAACTSIGRDNRHENIVMLWRNRSAPERLFGDWVMGLRSTIVAQDLLRIFQKIKKQQSAKAMLGQGYYEAFSDALRLLERVCTLDDAQQGQGMQAALPRSGPNTSVAPAHKTAGPARDVIAAMERRPFKPVTIVPDVSKAKPEQFNELSSLNTDASSMFKNSVPAEHTALFDLASQGDDDLLTMLDMPLRWALGRDLWVRRKTLSDKPLHWTYEGKLVVVFDHKTWRIGMHPELTSVSYEQSVMAERLRSANDIPTKFRHTTAYALFWDYIESDLAASLALPKRFFNGRIQLRRAPPVPPHGLSQHQQRIVALLSKAPERLGDLAQTMGLSLEHTAHELRPMYASRCVEMLDKS